MHLPGVQSPKLEAVAFLTSKAFTSVTISICNSSLVCSSTQRQPTGCTLGIVCLEKLMPHRASLHSKYEHSKYELIHVILVASGSQLIDASMAPANVVSLVAT